MAKRIYTETVKKWLIRSGITVGTLIGGIFLYLVAIGAISNVSYSGDIVCAGTPADPCYAFINFTANEDIFIYPTNYDPWGRDTLFDFDPNVKSWKLERKWGNYWWEYNLSEACATGNPRCGAKKTGEPTYSLAWRKGKDYQIRITGYKNSPYDTIKWGAFSGVDEIDPSWENTHKNSSIKEKLKDKAYKNYLRGKNSTEIKNGITKEYFSNEKRVKIYDKDNLLDLQLESNYVEVVLGWNDMDLIAWFDLKDFKGVDFINNVKFYDVNNNYAELNKSYLFKYKNSSDDWVEFELLSELPKKNIEIGLFIDIVSGDKIEWVIEKDGFYIIEWALVYGTNIGFVSVAPTTNPLGSNSEVQGVSVAFFDTSPSSSIRITEMGWWDDFQGSCNAQVGLYASDGVVVPDEAGTLIYNTSSESCAGTGNWDVFSGLNWSINSSTEYWLGLNVQGNLVRTDQTVSGGTGFDKDNQGSLQDPYGGGAILRPNGMYALYAVVEVEAPSDTCNPSSPLSANYAFTCSDNCTQSSNLDAGGFNITITDDVGSFTLTANITNFNELEIIKPSSCNVIFLGGKLIK